MAIWRDPLDDLIADLERSRPAAMDPAFEIPPPIEDYSLLVESILSRDPAKRLSLAADPAVKRVQAYHERLARLLRASESVEAPR
jgi:hypothetical protein